MRSFKFQWERDREWERDGEVTMCFAFMYFTFGLDFTQEASYTNNVMWTIILERRPTQGMATKSGEILCFVFVAIGIGFWVSAMATPGWFLFHITLDSSSLKVNWLIW